ncbi:MAG: hypothetical protein R2882_00340 [Gemmatimonadales bacterium]
MASFQETQRSDESVFFQQAFLLEPGSYNLTMVVRDPASNAASRVERVIEVPKYGAGSMSQPAMVYEVRGRTTPSDSLMRCSTRAVPRRTAAGTRCTSTSRAVGIRGRPRSPSS